MLNAATLTGGIDEARSRIQRYVRKTIVEHSSYYSELTGANVFFKYENLQVTGSFKLRGATNKFLTLSDAQQRTMVAASTGNHGRAIAHVANQFGTRATVFAPKTSDPSKIATIEELGAQVRIVGADCVDAEFAAREFATDIGGTYVSPYNDWEVVAGQGVVGAELCSQLDEIDAVYVSVGGGGLISGVASAVKSRFPGCRVVGCSPKNSRVMVESLAAGRILDLPSTETLSDGTAGGVEQDSITFDLCRDLIDECQVILEDDIPKCLAQFVAAHGMLIEGAAAVAIAGLIKTADNVRGKNVVVILCGRNIDFGKLAPILLAHDGKGDD